MKTLQTPVISTQKRFARQFWWCSDKNSGLSPILALVVDIRPAPYLITVFWHGINDTTFPMTRHSDKMTRDSRHGIIYFWKFSKKSFNQWVCGQGIKILKNPYMGTSRDLIGRCPCGDEIFFWKLLPNLKGWRILH